MSSDRIFRYKMSGSDRKRENVMSEEHKCCGSNGEKCCGGNNHETEGCGCQDRNNDNGTSGDCGENGGGQEDNKS